MTIKVYIPNIGTDELEVTDIMVKIEDIVHTNQPLVILEGDKISTEIPAPDSGIIKSIMINIGDKVNTGTLIMLIDHINDKDKKTITKDKKIITNDIIKHNHQQNKITFDNVSSAPIIQNNNNHIHATPLIRHMARVFGINLMQIHGTGRKGRILREDIQNYIKTNIQNKESKQQKNIPLNIPHWPQIDFNQFGDIEIQKLKHIQKISGANLHRNWIMLPHVTQFDEVDITELEKFRKQKNKEAEQEKINFKITPIIFIMKAVAKALKKLPQFNSSLSDNYQTLILKKYINIGIAVHTNQGLIVPVIKDVNKKNITTLTQELAHILKKTSNPNNNQLLKTDIQGGCFTISSLGKIGGTGFTPIVNVPEVAILGIAKASIKPIWNGKKFSPRLILPLALSYDHRVINGVDGAQFMHIINKSLSDIRNLIM